MQGRYFLCKRPFLCKAFPSFPAALHKSHLSLHAAASPPRCEAGLGPAVATLAIQWGYALGSGFAFEFQGLRPARGA